jgi:short-subunit dehydrogenase involved in D-alanine esterification of teichoic acids
MKYSITGHTQGIGQKLFERLSPDAVGFSKSTGHDIMQIEDRLAIIAGSKDSEIFINNAFQSDAQVKLLYELFEIWKNEKKIIINIGSETTCGIKKHAHPYAAYKAALDKSSEQLSHLNLPCKVVNIKFGWVGTNRVITNYNPASYISIDDACDIIIDTISWSQKYRVTEILVRPN